MIYQMGQSILDGCGVVVVSSTRADAFLELMMAIAVKRNTRSHPDFSMLLLIRQSNSLLMLMQPLILLQDKYRPQQQQQFKRPDDHPSVVTTQGAMPPLLSTPRDRGPSEISETMLCGEPISCFSVGGEFRLCLPQV